MKLKILEAHDRLLHFKKDQDSSIQQGVENCLKKNFDSLFYQERSPYVYIFAHPRTDDDGTSKIMFWQPRLLKPAAQTNSYLFRVLSNTDIAEPIWMLPPRELWPQYAKGKVTENEIVIWSVDRFINNRLEMEKPDPEDLPEERCKQIMHELIEVKRQNRENNKFMLKLNEFPKFEG
jgi:hypothetical protein